MKEKQKDDKLYTWMSLGLRCGVFTALGLVAIGLLVLALSQNGTSDAAVPLSELPQRVLSPDAKVISSLGIAVLLLTPIFQVVIAAASFAKHGDRRYLGISLTLLCLLALSLFLSVT